MPKAARYALVWANERDVYELSEQDRPEPLLNGDDQAWFGWLDAHNGFSFRGRAGQISLLKEARPGSDAGYWYAYRRHGKRTAKRYLGRSADLTVARLEEVAGALANIVHPPDAESQRVMSDVPQERSIIQVPHPNNGPDQRSFSSTRTTLGPQLVPLLAPKLQLPHLPTALVVRERLFTQLDQALECKLTVITAPAGFGKTTLVRQWLAEKVKGKRQKVKEPEGKVKGKRQKVKEPHNDSGHAFLPFTFYLLPSNIAWVSLDAGDNDPMRFWRYLLSACQSFGEDLGQAALALLATMLQPPFEPVSHETLLTSFLNDLTRTAQPSVLVLEDYHVITDAQIHDALAFFLEHLPPTLHLVILSRTSPLLPLARLRANGDLCELYASDIRFSSEETRRFLQQTSSITLDPAVTAQLDTQIEGWAAGLRLLTLALHGRQSTEAIGSVLTTFAGSNRTVLDYFVTEVLQAQPEHIQTFLLRTSILQRLTGSLCDAVLDDGPSHHRPACPEPVEGSIVLHELAHSNMFLEPLDETGGWYRYHALFADAMRYEARRRLGDAALRIGAIRASAWYEQHGSLAEAVEAALQGRDLARAAALIETIAENKLFIFKAQLFAVTNEAHTLRRWLGQIPDSVMEQHPALCLNYAIALLLLFMDGSQPRPAKGAIEHALDMAEAGFRAAGNTAKLGESFGFRSILAKQRGAIDESVDWARQSLSYLPAEEMAWRGASLSSIATGEQFAGRLDLARKLLIEARAISEAIENWSFTRAIIGMLSSVYVELGELHQAAASLRHTLAAAREQSDLDDIGHALIGLMELSYEWNALDAAEQQAHDAFAIGVQLADEEFQAQATLMLARIAYARGQTDQAQQQVDVLLHSLQDHPLLRLRWHARVVKGAQVRIQLAVGDLAAARRWVDSRSHAALVLPYFQQAREELLVARVLLAEGETDQALAILRRCLEPAQDAGHTHYVLEIQVLIARAYLVRKQLPEARQSLQTILARAAAEGYMRLFLDEGDSLATALRACVPHVRERPVLVYLETLLRAFDAEQGSPASATPFIETLSLQEQRVLDLLVAGRSNPEIAVQLIISVNTVKAHLKNIYRKLDVRNRTEASAAARQIGDG